MYGLDYLLRGLTLPLLVTPALSQTRTTVAAGASVIVTIKPNPAVWRLPVSDDFGNTVTGLFDCSIVWDDRPIGAFRLTSDLIGSGLGDRLTKYMGPIRNKVAYTFTNQDSVSQNFEFNSWALLIPQFLANKFMQQATDNLRALGLPYQTAQFPDIISQ